MLHEIESLRKELFECIWFGSRFLAQVAIILLLIVTSPITGPLYLIGKVVRARTKED